MPTLEGLAWRSTARLHWKDARLGYRGHRDDAIIDVASCPVLAPPLPTLLATVRARLMPVLRGTGTLRLSAGPGAAAGTVYPGRRPAPRRRLRRAALVGAPGCQGVVIDCTGKDRERRGQTENLVQGVLHPAEAFMQAHGRARPRSSPPSSSAPAPRPGAGSSLDRVPSRWRWPSAATASPPSRRWRRGPLPQAPDRRAAG
ncbi:MAG: hypothetical protein R3F43_32595 [bacterium]